MTTYKVTLSGLKKAEVMPLLEEYGKHALFKLEKEGEPEPKKLNGQHGGPRKRRSQGAALMLTGKEAQPGSIRAKALERFKRLEQKHGPGGVTRTMFREDLNKMDCDKSTMSSLVSAGLIKHVGE